MVKVKPLEGQALLDKVKELENLSREEKARACGYANKTKKGVERINSMKFLNALLEAENIQLDSNGKDSNNSRGGRSATFKVAVQSNGNLLIGSAYTKQMGLEPGDEFSITLGRKHIHLKKL
ncbi:MAG: AbrB family transcriptional regulator [Synechococcaceae cyanobacterium RL_1_2]|nr:AbrB family transcriptional regulator [Synechococcaceae cyanobacterium RL_1_2]